MLLLSKKKKKKNRKNTQLPIEVWTLIFTYLRLNDLIEISCVCKDFYLLCENDRFYVEEFNQSKKTFKDRSCFVISTDRYLNDFILICLINYMFL